MDEAAARTLRRAGLLHDLGCLAAPTGLWDKRAALSAAEWERVHLHSYWTDRVLRRSAALAPLADIAGRAHERLDGSGYHRGDAQALAPAARLLAAADVYRACTEDRAWRAAMSGDAARQAVLQQVQSGKLCARAVAAVLAAAGHGQPVARAGVDGHGAGPDEALSRREQEVLRLLVRGLSNKEIARDLDISPRTVQHHTIHIYAKTGVKSRAGVALWAVERGLFR
jgi:DNA-binding CsgD family transcriptional regulator